MKYDTAQDILRAVLTHMRSLSSLSRTRRTGSSFVLVATLFSPFFLSSCNRYIDKSKYDESQAELAQTKKQLEEAQKQITELSAHKFSTYESGFRTWRFDSATGETCILLTNDEDWKKKDTKEQSCNCEDNRAEYLKELLDTPVGEGRDLVVATWKSLLQDACGK